MIAHIDTVAQLNAFVDKAHIRSPDKIVAKLADSNILVNHSLAALLSKQPVSDSKPFSFE